MKNKGLIIGLSVVALIVLIIVIVVISRGGKSTTPEYGNLPPVPTPDGTDTTGGNWINKVTDLAKILEQIKNKGAGSGSPTITQIGVSWTPVASSTGLCKSPAMLNKTIVLKNGSRSGEVCALQSYLNTKGAGLVNDGIFGANTEKALKNATGKTSITLGEIITV